MELPQFRIENSIWQSSAIEDKFSRVLQEMRDLSGLVIARVTGQPLHIYTDTTEQHFDDCAWQLDLGVLVGRVRIQRIPPVGHWHLSDNYLSDDGYPIMSCYDEQGTEYVMGMRSSLGFELELLEP